MINVWGDSTVTGIVAHLSRKEVAEMENNGIPEIHIPGHAAMPPLNNNNEKTHSIPLIQEGEKIVDKNFEFLEEKGSQFKFKF